VALPAMLDFALEATTLGVARASLDQSLIA
jgi:hypothetical protein